MTQPVIMHTCYIVAVLDIRGWVPTVRKVALASAPAGSLTVMSDAECPVDVLSFRAPSFHEATERALEYVASEQGAMFHGWVCDFLPDRDKARVQALRLQAERAR